MNVHSAFSSTRLERRLFLSVELSTQDVLRYIEMLQHVCMYKNRAKYGHDVDRKKALLFLSSVSWTARSRCCSVSMVLLFIQSTHLQLGPQNICRRNETQISFCLKCVSAHVCTQEMQYAPGECFMKLMVYFMAPNLEVKNIEMGLRVTKASLCCAWFLRLGHATDLDRSPQIISPLTDKTVGLSK